MVRAAELLGLDAVDLGAMPPKEAAACVQQVVDGKGWSGEELEHALQENGGTVGLFRHAPANRLRVFRPFWGFFGRLSDGRRVCL